MTTHQTKFSANSFWSDLIYDTRNVPPTPPTPAAPTVTTDSLVMHNPLYATVDGTITDQGYPDVTEYGFVWATHDNPTLDDHVIIVGMVGFLGEFSNTSTPGTLPSSGRIYFSAYATNTVGTSYGAVLSDFPEICLMEGTSISLPHGKKKIELVGYNDRLLAWNFDDARLATAKPVWMVKPFSSPRFSLVKFSDGSELGTIADGKGHRIFNIDKGMFTHMMSDDTPIGTKTFTDTGKIVSLASKKVINKRTTFYNIITHTHINVFANGILTSTGLNNIYPINHMKFVKENRKSRREEFKNVPYELFSGLRLGEQPMSYYGLKEKISMMMKRQF